jgi:hypothetical protein
MRLRLVALELVAALNFVRHPPATTIEFDCGAWLHFSAVFAGKQSERLRIRTSRDQFQLRRTTELKGRKFVDDSGSVIFVMGTRSASLTRGDTLIYGCTGSVPRWQLK